MLISQEAQVRQTPESLLSPQCRTILRHMKTTGSITQREALMDHSVQSLTRRITELYDHGYDIYKEPKQHPITGQRYMRYSLMRNKSTAV